MDNSTTSTMSYPYTTTPDQRVGPGPPYSNMSMEINLFFRVFLGIIANITCWVPMRILWKNGEFAASVLCMVTMTLNVYYVVNALIWRNDNVQTWYDGRGWCDLQIYTVYPIQTIYAACFFTIMHNVATKVGMMRATVLNSSEKRRRNLREALILFTIPLLQVIMTYFVLEQRFNVATLIGCRNIYHRSWVYVSIFNMPIPIFTILAVFFSILTWIRFRQVEKSTSMARHTSSVTHRNQRMRRKLYLLSLCILIPFFPLQMLFMYSNIMNSVHRMQPYDFAKIHNSGIFNRITFTVSAQTSFPEMNLNYISVITVVPIFWFFGVTKEAMNTYRVYFLACGLGKWFPRLHDEYDPDRTRTGTSRSWGAQLGSLLKSNKTTSGSRKNSILPTVEHVSQNSDTTSRSDPDSIKPAPLNAPPTLNLNPWPDLSATTTPPHPTDGISPPHRNPFIFRNVITVPKLPFFRRHHPTSPPVPLTAYKPSHHPHPRPGSDTNELIRPETGDSRQLWTPGMPVRTRVWSQDDGIRSVQDDGVDLDLKGGAEGSRVRVETRIERKESL